MFATQPELREMLLNTINECLDANRPFSAYNITKWTREREHIRLRHSELGSEYLHQLDIIEDVLDYGHTAPDGQTYTWKRTEFNNWSGPPFQVYHPLAYDINNFVPEGSQPANSIEVLNSVRPASLIGQVTPAADGTQADSGGEQSDGTYKTDFRNRLMVPKRFLKEAGIQAGDTVYVIADKTTQTLTIALDSTFDGEKFTTQRVERNGDIRLSSTTLRAADLTDNRFVIETSEMEIDQNKLKVVEVKAAV